MKHAHSHIHYERMILISLFFVSFILLFYSLGPIVGTAIHILTLAFIQAAFPNGVHALRASRFARWLSDYFAPLQMDEQSRARLQQSKLCIYLVEPHGPLVLTLSLLFAAHGGRLDETVARKTVVMAHRVAMIFPVCAQIFQLFGVVYNHRERVVAALKLKNNIALCPSGWIGKEKALTAPCPGGGVVWKRDLLGIIELAKEYDCDIVPIFSPDEQSAYSVATLRGMPWWAAFIYGRRFLFARKPVRVFVGEPIVPESREHPAAITSRYYAELTKLIESSGVEVGFHFQTSSGRANEN